MTDIRPGSYLMGSFFRGPTSGSKNFSPQFRMATSALESSWGQSLESGDGHWMTSVYGLTSSSDREISVEQVMGAAESMDEYGFILDRRLDHRSTTLLDFLAFEWMERPSLHLKMLEWLLYNEANVNAVDSRGRNCIHYAVEHRLSVDTDYVATLRALLVAGCDPNALQFRGITPLDHAFRYGRIGTLALWTRTGILTDCGYSLVEAPKIDEDDTGLIVVLEGTGILPISGLSVEEHLEMKRWKRCEEGLLE